MPELPVLANISADFNAATAMFFTNLGLPPLPNLSLPLLPNLSGGSGLALLPNLTLPPAAVAGGAGAADDHVAGAASR